MPVPLVITLRQSRSCTAGTVPNPLRAVPPRGVSGGGTTGSVVPAGDLPGGIADVVGGVLHRVLGLGDTVLGPALGLEIPVLRGLSGYFLGLACGLVDLVVGGHGASPLTVVF